MLAYLDPGAPAEKSSSLGAGEIALIVLGVTVLLLVAAAAVKYLRKG